MQLHSLKRVHENKKSRSVGRGGKRGKTSGRGGKGQTARAGHKARPEIRDFIKRLPKLRGRGKNSNLSIQAHPAIVNVGALEVFSVGAEVNPAILIEKKLVEKKSGVTPKVKILGDGALTKKLTITGCAVSESAREKIEKAGGTIA